MNKQELIQALYNSVKVTQLEGEVHMEIMFDKQADAIIELWNKSLTTEPQVDKVTAEEVLDKVLKDVENGSFKINTSKLYHAEDVVIQAMQTYATQSNAEAKGEYSIEKQEDGTYRLYWSGDNDKLLICTLSNFFTPEHKPINIILKELNNAEAMREHAIGFAEYYEQNLSIHKTQQQLYNEYLTTLTK